MSQCRRSQLSGILMSTSTPTSAWGPMSPTPSEHVSRHCADPQCTAGSSSACFAHTGLITSHQQTGPVQLGSCWYYLISAGLTSVHAKCHCSTHLLTSDIRSHDSTASGAALGTHPGANPVQAVCSGISLCARHSTGVSGWQPAAADIRGCCSSSSALCRLSDDAGAVNPAINSQWSCISCGCSAGVEQSATTDQGRLLTIDISAGDQVSSFPSVIWLTEVWHCLCWLTVQLSARDMQHYLCFFVKCPRNCCILF